MARGKSRSERRKNRLLRTSLAVLHRLQVTDGRLVLKCSHCQHLSTAGMNQITSKCGRQECPGIRYVDEADIKACLAAHALGGVMAEFLMIDDLNTQRGHKDDGTWKHTAMSRHKAKSFNFGHRADRLIVDDPHAPQPARTKAERDAVSAWYTSAAISAFKKP